MMIRVIRWYVDAEKRALSISDLAISDLAISDLAISDLAISDLAISDAPTHAT